MKVRGDHLRLMKHICEIETLWLILEGPFMSVDLYKVFT